MIPGQGSDLDLDDPCDPVPTRDTAQHHSQPPRAPAHVRCVASYTGAMGGAVTQRVTRAPARARLPHPSRRPLAGPARGCQSAGHRRARSFPPFPPGSEGHTASGHEDLELGARVRVRGPGGEGRRAPQDPGASPGRAVQGAPGLAGSRRGDDGNRNAAGAAGEGGGRRPGTRLDGAGPASPRAASCAAGRRAWASPSSGIAFQEDGVVALA